MDPDLKTALVSGGTSIVTFIGAWILMLLKQKSQEQRQDKEVTHEQGREIRKDGLAEMQLVIEELRKDNEELRKDIKENKGEIDGVRDELKECHKRHAREMARREYIEEMMRRNGIKLKPHDPEGG